MRLGSLSNGYPQAAIVINSKVFELYAVAENKLTNWNVEFIVSDIR